MVVVVLPMTLFEQLASLTTEEVNPQTTNIDLAQPYDIAKLLNSEDMLVANAVESVLNEVGVAIDTVAQALLSGGRLIYVGAGTSGRLGILDASEMPPTFGTDPDLVVGLIAGGREAAFKSVEGAEDSREYGRDALESISANASDVVCGISASGRTPFVLGALDYAHSVLCKTILISTNPASLVRTFCPSADVLICPVVGPEPICGSTRMKSGTAQKMVLNMISTGAMIRMGKTFGNIMVDVQPTNDKLIERAKSIVMSLTNSSYIVASNLLSKSSGDVKTAVIMGLTNCTYNEAIEQLSKANGVIRRVLEGDN